MKKVNKQILGNYMSMPYTRVVYPISDESGSYYVGSILEFDGCMTTGDTAAEVYELLDDAMEGWLEVKLEHGDYIPEPLEAEEYSGKFMIRIPPSLHKKLAMEARLQNVSLNQYAMFKLAK